MIMLEPKRWLSKLTVINLLINYLSTSAQLYPTQDKLYEEDPCVMEDGSTGKCILMRNCPIRIKQLQEGQYNPSSGHCSFDNFDEIVCCPTTLQNNISFPENEGSACVMEDGSVGDCIALPNCPIRVKEVLEGRRSINSPGHCSFNGHTEIVCCPLNTESNTNENSNGLNIRPAAQACRNYQTKITDEDDNKINPQILNGKSAELGEFPYMVALGFLQNTIDSTNDKTTLSIYYYCGGTLISDRYVLTAAHCLSNIQEWQPQFAKLGSVDLNDQAYYVQLIPVFRSIPHPRYRRSKSYNDIGLIVLERPVTYSKYVVPICLQTIPIPNLDQLIKMSLVVTGWGATSLDSSGTPNLQKTPSLQLVNKDQCQLYYENFEKLSDGIDDSLICIVDADKSRNADSCQGDSGGPLLLLSMYTSTVIGVVSFGQSCGTPIPAVYTSVYYYLDWIEQIVWPN